MRENIVLTIIILVIGFFAFKFFMRASFGSKMFNWLSINAPKVGDLVRKVNIARILNTLALLSSGVPILQSITITKDITGNKFYERALSYPRRCARW